MNPVITCKCDIKRSQSIIQYILTLILIFSFLSKINAQNNRIVVEFTPLYSYLLISGDYPYNTEGEDNPKPGVSTTIKFETDINKYLSLSSGISYEFRQNKYSGTIYDTADVILTSEPIPYRYNSSNAFQFIGIPVSLNINYLNYPKLRVYQTIGIKASFLVSAEYDVEQFYENGTVENVSGNFSGEKSDIIFSLSSSIGVRKKLGDNLSIKIEPGFSYMLNKYIEMDHYEQKFFDLKLDIGFSYDF